MMKLKQMLTKYKRYYLIKISPTRFVFILFKLNIKKRSFIRDSFKAQNQINKLNLSVIR